MSLQTNDRPNTKKKSAPQHFILHEKKKITERGNLWCVVAHVTVFYSSSFLFLQREKEALTSLLSVLNFVLLFACVTVDVLPH
jgi:hypothetical protein